MPSFGNFLEKLFSRPPDSPQSPTFTRCATPMIQQSMKENGEDDDTIMRELQRHFDERIAVSMGRKD